VCRLVVTKLPQNILLVLFFFGKKLYVSVVCNPEHMSCEDVCSRTTKHSSSAKESQPEQIDRNIIQKSKSLHQTTENMNPQS
jgi:hypothetical protein